MIPILFSSFHPNEPENHMNSVPDLIKRGRISIFLVVKVYKFLNFLCHMKFKVRPWGPGLFLWKEVGSLHKSSWAPSALRLGLRREKFTFIEAQRKYDIHKSNCCSWQSGTSHLWPGDRGQRWILDVTAPPTAPCHHSQYPPLSGTWQIDNIR